MSGRELVGRVVSNRMQKTVVVAINRVLWNAKYKGYERRSSKIMARRQESDLHIGDLVRIHALPRKLSKHVAYNVADVIKRVQVYDKERAKGMLQTWEEERKQYTNSIQRAQDRLDAARKRLQLAREAYQNALGSGTVLPLQPAAGTTPVVPQEAQ